MNRNLFYTKYVKRLLDVFCSAIAIVVLSPVLIVISVLIRVKLGTPVIFVQKRPGLNERIFSMYKFRTMTNQRDDEGNLLPDHLRFTNFGRILRSTSIDEIPELFNIFLGNMSFVGPRPQLVKDLVFMSSEQRLRHAVRPGLTGLAQVNGRNSVTWESKLEFDLRYLSEISFWADLRILLRTIPNVFRREGINASGFETGEDFGDYLLRCNEVTEQQYASLVELSQMMVEKSEVHPSLM